MCCSIMLHLYTASVWPIPFQPETHSHKEFSRVDLAASHCCSLAIGRTSLTCCPFSHVVINGHIGDHSDSKFSKPTSYYSHLFASFVWLSKVTMGSRIWGGIGWCWLWSCFSRSLAWDVPAPRPHHKGDSDPCYCSAQSQWFNSHEAFQLCEDYCYRALSDWNPVLPVFTCFQSEFRIFIEHICQHLSDKLHAVQTMAMSCPICANSVPLAWPQHIEHVWNRIKAPKRRTWGRLQWPSISGWWL